jgi:DNA-binding beta-propeller fold protein YncE
MNRPLANPMLRAAALLGALLATTTAGPARVLAAESTYRLVEHWAQLPPGYTWGTMSAVAIDSKGNIYGFQRDDPTSKVLVFDVQGKYLRTWGEGTFPYAHGMRALRDGFIWTTDRQAQLVLKFDSNGALLFSLGQKNVAGNMDSTDAFNGASDVAMAENGDIFVSDGEGQNTRVVKFSKDGRFIKAWGTKGDAPGQLNGPHCIAIDSKGRVWVGDRGNKRLQIFDQDGKYLGQMAQFGTPASIFITKDDTLYVAAPAPENRVTIGTTDGRVLETIEGLDAPHGIAVDANGAIYVAESGGKAILKFAKK